MSDNHKYLRIVAENDEYITPSNKKKNPLPTSLIFYSNLFRIILYSNRNAKKGIYDNFRWANSSLDIFESLERSGIRFHLTGMNNMKKVDTPVVFIGNHMSTLETMVLPAIIQPVKPVLFVIKEELANYPLFGPIAKARDPILVGRENPRQDLRIVLEEGSRKIQNGKSVVIFPQRTRSLNFETASFNSLGVKLARRNNVPVIPMAILSDAWGNGKYIKEIGKIDTSKEVRISFGEPIYISGNGTEDHQRVIDFISGKLKEWGREEILK
jgi:1-acyl-sn-glycerol-3-phosphate acyltransferase